MSLLFPPRVTKPGRAAAALASLALLLGVMLQPAAFGQETSTRIENNDPSVIYRGTWSVVQESRASGGSFHQARSAGAAVTYTFTGPFVTWVFSKGPNRGIARVIIDGQVREENFDLYAPTEQFQQSFTWGGMQGDASHTIRIEVTGTRNGLSTDTFVDVDAFLVIGQGTALAGTPLPSGPQLRFENDDPAMIYGGTWSRVRDSRASGGSVEQSREPRSFVRFRFSGSYVAWVGARGPNRGIAHVMIDGGEREEDVDLYAATEQFGVIRVYDGLRPDVPHIIRIEATGARNGASSDSLIDVDAIVVAQANVTPVPTSTPTPAATPTPSPTATPAATPTPRPLREYAVDARFRSYYERYDGFRVMGRAISPAVFQDQRWVQYFEKARLEDHTGESPDPNWQFLYGLLADELLAAKADIPVGGDRSTQTYRTLAAEADPSKLRPAPSGFTGGVQRNPDGSVFVPFSAGLQPAAGHNVAPVFWDYINRADLFPGGWLHDVGLPLTEAIEATVDKGPATGRVITIQVFQRTVLTYDPLNPPEWRVERANVGSDYAQVFPGRVPQ